MSTRSVSRLAVVCLVAATWACASLALAQQSAPPATSQPAQPARPTSDKASATQAAVDDAARKAEILASPRWRRAMFELNEWLGAQKLYTPAQVTKIKQNFTAKVNRLSAQDLQFMLDDMDAKFKVLETPQAQDARAWLAQYLSILSDKKREEVIGKLGNVATMTAPQLEAQIAAIEQRRAASARQQQAVNQLRDSAPNPWTQNTRMAEQAYVREHEMQRSAYSSPYSASAPGKKPFSDVNVGTGMGFYVTPYGGVGMMFGGF